MKINIPNVSFEVTSDCNLNCKYCYNHWKANKPNKLTNDTYKLSLNSIKQLLHTAHIKHITFTGGEPLLAERFMELVLFVRMKGIDVSIISNGTFADNHKYEQLHKLGVSLFELPVHSHNAFTHDYLTNSFGTWEKSISSIKHLLSLNANIVAVVVLTKANCNEISKTLEFIHSLGITKAMVNRFNIGGKGIREINNLLPSRDELTQAFEDISIKASKLRLSVSSNVCTPICVLNPKHYRGIRFTSCSSDFTKRPLTVDFKGDVRFCNHSPKILGNIFNTSISNILISNSIKQWTTIPDFCVSCKAFDQCKAGCRAASEQMGLTLNYPDPIVNFIGYDKEIINNCS